MIWHTNIDTQVCFIECSGELIYELLLLVFLILLHKRTMQSSVLLCQKWPVKSSPQGEQIYCANLFFTVMDINGITVDLIESEACIKRLCCPLQLHGYRGIAPLGLQVFIGTADERLLKPHAFYQVHRITGKTVTTPSMERMITGTKVLEIPLEPKNHMRVVWVGQRECTHSEYVVTSITTRFFFFFKSVTLTNQSPCTLTVFLHIISQSYWVVCTVTSIFIWVIEFECSLSAQPWWLCLLQDCHLFFFCVVAPNKFLLPQTEP